MPPIDARLATRVLGFFEARDRKRRAAPATSTGSPVKSAARELACRVNDGLRVLLLWDPADDAVTVSVADARSGRTFEGAVPRERAMHAFHHPFAYVA